MKYNKTNLDVAKAFERQILHRDYFAHYLRWSFVFKIIKSNAKILDIGCAPQALLAETLYRNKKTPDLYVGVDIRNLDEAREKFKNCSWCKFIEQDIVTKSLYLDNTFDYITCFEVLEHVGKQNAQLVLANCLKNMGPETILLLSTPNFNGKDVANNHMIEGQVGEFTYNELKELLLKEFTIEDSFATFASQKDYYDSLTTEEQKIFNVITRYYDSNVVSVMFAPLIEPELGRNVMWILRQKQK